MNRLESIKKTLQEQGLRVTQPRLAVATILTKNDKSFLTPEEMFKKIQKSKRLHCDQVSVYRTLSTFTELGLVIKNTFQGEASRYKLPPSKNLDHAHHEHFFKCNQCQKIEPFKDCFVSKKEKELEKRGFQNLHHHLEITGLCPSCARH